MFFVSGLLSLVYQIVWSRALLPVFGTNLPAVTVTVATFVGGLGLGAHLVGRRIDRWSPWKTYALLELGIAGFGLLLPHLVAPLGALFARITPIGAPAPAVHLVRFAGVAVLLAGPCVLMGGTFPAFVRGFSWSRSRLGGDLGAAYAANTVGAACGALLAGTWLVPCFSLSRVSATAAVGNVALAAIAWAFSAREQQHTRIEPTSDAPPAAAAATWVPLSLLLITGYVSMSFELLWTRALVQVLGASTFSFSLALGAMLLGLCAGSTLYRAALARGHGRRLLPYLMALLLLASLLSFLLVAHLPQLYRALRAALPRFAMAPVALSLIAFGPTATVLGALFPACVRRHADGGGGVGRGIGLAYAANTIGAVLGVVLTGLVSIVRLGSGGSLRPLFLLLAAGLGVAWFSTMPRRARAPGIVALALSVASIVMFPRDIFYANQLGSIRTGALRDGVVLFQDEDSAAMATLLELPGTPFRHADGAVIREGNQRHIFHSNGRTVGGTSIYLWNVVGGYLAALLHPDPRDILLIGYGSGRQLKTLESVSGPRHIEVVEVNPINFRASDLLYLSSREVLGDPRVAVHVDDGRNHLLRSRRTYDVIVIDVGGIETDGGELFYTREFLQLCRDRLRDGGMVMTWMYLGTLREPRGVLYQRTLREVFPESSVWLGTGEPTNHDSLWLIGSKGTAAADFARLRQRWAALTAAQRAELSLAGVASATDFAALHLAASRDPPAALGPERVLTDDRPGLRPIWRHDPFAGEPPGFAQASEQWVRELLATDVGPLPSGATDAEIAAVRARRSALQSMVLASLR